MDNRELVRLALEARERSYSPYSGFRVGAALLCASGKVYQGCNIESASFSPTNCAERTAFFKAVYEGERDFVKIAVAGSFADGKPSGDGYAAPCGVCRQVMAEFCRPEEFFVVLAKDLDGPYREHTLSQLLPFGFGPGHMK